MNEWISVEERLPEIGVFVNIRKQGVEIEVEATPFEDGLYWLSKSGDCYKGITHWRPIQEVQTTRWISVEKRLPVNDHTVVACNIGERDVYLAAYCETGWLCGPSRIRPTHWQPLPELPKAPGPFYVGDSPTIGGCIKIAGKVVYHRKAGYICPLVNEGTAQGVADRLNDLWQQDKGSTDETDK